MSPAQLFLSLPTYWKINQNYGRKRLVAKIQDSLQCWMKQVQICFYYSMASGKIITPNFGCVRNSAKYVNSQRVVVKVNKIKCVLIISGELWHLALPLSHHNIIIIKSKGIIKTLHWSRYSHQLGNNFFRVVIILGIYQYCVHCTENDMKITSLEGPYM